MLPELLYGLAETHLLLSIHAPQKEPQLWGSSVHRLHPELITDDELSS